MPFFQRFVVPSLALLALLLAGPAFAGAEPQILELTLGKSLVLKTDKPISRLSLADPAIAEVLLLSRQQVYLTGKVIGGTNLTLWDEADQVANVYELVVRANLTELKTVLYETLPHERSYRLIPAGDTLTLAGSVSSPESVTTIKTLAEEYGSAKVVNLLQVEGVQQVMVEVQVAEMTRSAMERLGMDFSFFFEGNFAYSMLNQLYTLDNQGPLSIFPQMQEFVYGSPSEYISDLEKLLSLNAEYPGMIDIDAMTSQLMQEGDFWKDPGNMSVSSTNTGMFRFQDGNRIYTGFLDALKGEGLVKVLAEPNLICISGQSSKFLAGGEIPIPVPQGLGTVAIEYKPYGVGLNFTPTVLESGKISMQIAPEVSELDYTSAVSVSGFVIPGITTRKASTVIELRDGQTFAIAGLIKESMREGIDKLPALGDLPILGTLFRSSEFQNEQSELIIMVTPHLVQPLDKEQQKLPTDFFAEPNEFEFHILGYLEDTDKDTENPAMPPLESAPAPNRAVTEREQGLDGSFGHLMPDPWLN